jgi:hypothetical protein
MNMLAFLLGYLAILVFAITSLVALGLLIARLIAPARILFAAGLACAAGIAGVALLSFHQEDFRDEASVPMIALTALSFLLAGTGQLVAAIRSPRTYGAAFGCAAASIVIVVAFPFLGADIIGGFGQSLVGLGVPLAVASMLPAMASLMIASFLPIGSRPTAPARS